MVIRPIDIRRKEFKSGFRGYDADQVDEFLDSVADEFERTYTENQRMREEISSLRERLEQFERLEGSIQTALVHAEQAANDLRNSANRESRELRNSATREAENLRQSATREAELTLREAKARSHQMLAETSERVERVRESYEALREAKRLFTADFRHVLRSYLEVLDKADIATAKEIEASLRERLDTESISAARQAAEQERREHEDDSEEPAAEESTEQAGTSPRMESTTGDLSGREVAERTESEPEVVEPEVEPSSAEGEDESAQEEVAEQTSAGSPESEEVEGEEESTLDQESGLAAEPSSEEFWERDEDRKGSGEGDDRQKSRIFRASRFLQRRGDN